VQGEQKQRHLSDEELIYLGAGLKLPPQPNQETRDWQVNHLTLCSQCNSEVNRLRHAAMLWDDPDWVRQMHSRLPQPLPREPLCWWSRFLLLSSPLLPFFRPPVAAYASGITLQQFPFPIYEGDTEVTGLRGYIQKRDDAFYAWIEEQPTQETDYQDQQIELVIVEPDSGQPILQRSLRVGQLTLLGTLLPISERTRAMARIVP